MDYSTARCPASLSPSLAGVGMLADKRMSRNRSTEIYMP
jgi:hypothetical protein